MLSILRIVLAVALMNLSAAARADVTVVEFHHTGFDHYFMTSVPDEIAKLDARLPPLESWLRTGRSFRAYEKATAPAGAVDICRFFNDTFAPKSSHFYAPKGLGCEATIAKYPDWRLEDDRLFSTMLPDADGICPSGTSPVYRLYNGGRGGAPNHRFVTGLEDRQAMLDTGFVPEGAGMGVGMCVPRDSAERNSPEGLWRGTSDRGHAVRIIVLDDGTFYLLYANPGSATDTGVVMGTGTSNAGAFQSSAALELTFAHGLKMGSGGPVTGTYVPRATLVLKYGAVQITATYDTSYDEPVDVAALAGNYVGRDGHKDDPHQARAQLDPRGNLSIDGVEFDFAGTLSARGQTGVMNVSLSSAFLKNAPGHAFFDRAINQLCMLVPFDIQGPDVLFLFAQKQ